MERCAIIGKLIPGSSMVEQEAVNFEVTGSSPVRGAILDNLELWFGNFCCSINFDAFANLEGFKLGAGFFAGGV